LFRVAVETIEQLQEPIRNGLGDHRVVDRLQLVGDESIRQRRGRA
jgi:hypothetical protein